MDPRGSIIIKEKRKHIRKDGTHKEIESLEMDEKELKDKLGVLKKVVELKPAERNEYFKKCTDEDLHDLSEACFNVLKNTTKVSGKELKSLKRKLKRIKTPFKAIASVKRSLKNKRRLLCNKQVGRGIVSIIASTVIPALIAALAK